MEYKYLLEEKANKNFCFNDIINENGSCVLNIICYHVGEQYKYPFLQFMMEKIPYCNNIVKEQLIFPYIFIKDLSNSIEETVLQKVKSRLDIIGCDYNRVTNDMYKGILFGNGNRSLYVLVNITGIDIYGLNFTRQTTCWFVLPSEIINTKKVCNIDVDKEVTDFFTDVPYLGLLFNNKTNEPYILPDAVYTGSEIKLAEFKSVFGNTKEKKYNSCSEYYFFYKSFSDAVKDGGWLKDGFSNKIGDRVIVDKNSNKYVTGCINRYALFVEGKIYLETGREFKITDDIIEHLHPEPCIIICYTGNHDISPDLLVKKYESFVPLSYHKLNKNLLDEHFIEENKKEYMIE